jgi:hypothetical protein
VPNPWDRVLAVRVAPEWSMHPVWVRVRDDPFPENVAPEELHGVYGVSEDVCTTLEAWDLEFQDTFLPDDPMGSGFVDVAAAERWERRGLELAHRLAREVGPGVPLEFAARHGTVEIPPDAPASRDGDGAGT